MVPKELHLEYNKYYDAPPLPKTVQGRFGAILLSVAGYLPAEAVDVREHPQMHELSLQERQAIWQKNDVRPQMGSDIQDFIIEHVIEQGVKGLDAETVEEFVLTCNQERKFELGQYLFRLAAEVATEPIEMAYVRAWHEGLLPRQDLRGFSASHGGIGSARAVPRSPRLFVDRHIPHNPHKKKRVLQKFEDRIQEALAA